MTERLFPTIRSQAHFLKALENLKADGVRREFQATLVPSQAEESQAPGEVQNPEPQPQNFPPLVRQALINEDVGLKCARRTKIKTMLIQVMFDQLSQITLYPSHRQYVEYLSSFITKFPFMKERIGSGYDALHQSIKNKFKKERLSLTQDSDINRMKEKFRVLGSGRKRPSSNTETVPMKRTQRSGDQEIADTGEDERSIVAHTDDMGQEMEKARPNLALLESKMMRTKSFRKNFIMTHSTKEIVEKFPCLKMPKLLPLDMKAYYSVDTDKLIVTNLNAMAASIIRRAPSSKLKDSCRKTVDDCIADDEKKGLQLGAAVLLLPSLFREQESLLFLTDKLPENPSPAMMLTRGHDGDPLNPEKINIFMDSIEIVEEDPSIDISYGLAIMFALYYVHGIEYPKGISKTMLFLERFVFKLNSNSPVPVTVGRVFNSLCDE